MCPYFPQVAREIAAMACSERTIERMQDIQYVKRLVSHLQQQATDEMVRVCPHHSVSLLLVSLSLT